MDETKQMPNAPWWSQPGASPTAVLPEADSPSVPPPYPPPPAPVKDRGPSKSRGTAVLLALALLAGGGAGGAVASALDHDSSNTAVGSLNRSSGALTTAAVKGSPEAAAATIGPSVVTVEVSGTSSGFGGRAVSGTGSGIVIRTDGYILTNNHVVAAAVGGGTVSVTLSDGRTVPAKIVGTDPTSDLGVLKVDGVRGLKAATFADSSELKVGQAVLAIGAPLGLANTVTQGIVSTLHRPVRTGEAGASSQAVLDAVQTDAAINPGNSGGALVDLAGRVVGINSAIATAGDGSSGNIGVGFAIPSNDAQRVAEAIITSGKVTHAQIGVSVNDTASGTAGAPGLGATLAAVAQGSPADKAGLQAGDIVTKVGDRRVTDADSLIVAVRANNPGDKVTVTYTRGGATRTTDVTLAGVS